MSANKGADLERRVGRVEYGDGGLVRLRWPVSSPGDSLRTVTDVDVLVIDFDSRLRSTVSIIECKSVRGQTGEQDRLLWLTGLRKVVGADRAVLVRESTSRNGRDLARILEIDLIGARELNARELEHEWLPSDFGVIGDSQFPGFEVHALRQIKAVGSIPSPLLAFLRNDALLAPPHRVLGALGTLSELIANGSVLPEPAGQFLSSHAFQALLLSAVRAAGQLDSSGLSVLREQIEDGMFAGDPEDKRTGRIIRLADALLREQASLMHKAYVESGARPIGWAVPSLMRELYRMPSWLDRYCDLVLRLRRRPNLSRQLPQVMDLVLFEALVGGNQWKVPAFDHLFTVEHRQLAVMAFDLFNIISPALAERISALREIPFNRAPQVMADRRKPPEETVSTQLELPTK